MRNKEYQTEVLSKLERIFVDGGVVPEWDVARNSEDEFTRALYSPRLDFAVGPFNIDANIIWNNNRIDEFYVRFQLFLQKLKSMSDMNDSTFKPNKNPRCFLAIELEDKTSRKHRIGTIINASAMGKIGIIVAANESVFRSFQRIRKYLVFLQEVSKSNYNPKNVMILKKEDFLRILEEEAGIKH